MPAWTERPELQLNCTWPPAERYAGIGSDVIERGRDLLDAIMREVPRAALPLADGVRIRTVGRFHDEACAIADLVDTDWRSVIIANISYDLAVATMGCSTVALPTCEGPVLARNMDWWPEHLLARASYLIRHLDGDDAKLVHAGWPGSIGVVSGLSRRGFAVVLNAVTSNERPQLSGYPVMLFIRQVLDDADSFEQAVNMLAEQRLVCSCLLSVVGTRNFERVVIERTATQSAQRWGLDDKPLVATNDYRKLMRPRTSESSELYQTTCTRFDHLSAFFAEPTVERTVDDDELLYRVTDPHIMQTITAQHVIIRPRAGSVRLFVPRALLETDPPSPNP